MHDLVDMLGTCEIAQPHGPQIAQRNRGWQTVGSKRGHGLRQEHLTAMGSAHDTCRTIDDGAEEVVVAALVDTRMQTAPDLDGNAAGGVGIGECLLQLEHRSDRIDGIVEGCVDAITQRLHDQPAMAFDRRPGERVVTRERRGHPLRLLFPQPGAALDVGKKKSGDGGSFLHAGIFRASDHGKFTLRQPRRLDWQAPATIQRGFPYEFPRTVVD